MIYRVSLFVFLSMFFSICHAVEYGISSSGQNVSLDFWFQDKQKSKTGFYSRVIADFDEYQNGDMVTVCQDGSISGAIGSGTCSGHGGADYVKEADFNRVAVIVGPSYWVAEKVQLHGGLIIGFYTSDINIGDTSKHDYSEAGIDVGASYKPLSESDVKIVLSYETERDKTSIGFSMPF